MAVGLGYVAGVVHYGDVANVRGELPRAGCWASWMPARERARRRIPSARRCCGPGFGDDLEVALERYVTAHWDYVDAWTGRDALVFVPDRNSRANAQRAREVMRYLDVPADAPPCAVFFLPASDPPQRRLVGRFVRLIPRGPDGSYREGDVAAALRALCAALVTCGQLPVQQRLDILKQEMKVRRAARSAGGCRRSRCPTCARTCRLAPACCGRWRRRSAWH